MSYLLGALCLTITSKQGPKGATWTTTVKHRDEVKINNASVAKKKIIICRDYRGERFLLSRPYFGISRL